MNEHNSLIEYISNLLRFVQHHTGEMKCVETDKVFYSGESYSFESCEESRNIISTSQLAIRETYKPNMRVSSDFLSSQIKSLCLNIKRNNFTSVEMGSEFDKWITHLLSYPREYEFYIPIAGLDLQGTSISLGASTFIPGGKSFLDYVISKGEQQQENNLTSSPIMKSISESLEILKFREKFGNTIACIRIQGDPESIIDPAIAKLSESLNALLFLIRPSNASFSFNRLGIRGFDDTLAIYYCAIDSVNEIKISEIPFSITFPIRLTDSVQSRMLTNGFNILNDILNKHDNKLDEVEKKLKLALYWYYEACHSLYLHVKLLYFVFILEIILSSPGEGISRHISECLSLLVVENPLERKAFAKRVRDLYNLRNDIAHRGKTVFKFDELDFAEQIAFEAISFLIKNNSLLHSNLDIDNMLCDLRLARECMRVSYKSDQSEITVP
jgi:hypothetical protein